MKIPSNIQQPQNAQNNLNKELKPYLEVAEGMETQFTTHLLNEMRKTVPKDEAPSSAMNYYESLVDYERAKLMAESDSGLGVKKVILNEILPSHLKAKMDHKQVLSTGKDSQEKNHE